MAKPESDPAKLAENISNCILKCVTESGIKTNKKYKKKNSNKNNAPWFDDRCQTLKNKVRKLATKLKHSPENNFLRETYRISTLSSKK